MQAAPSITDDDDKLEKRIVTSGQRRYVILINESGLYGLILSSKLEQAKAFKRRGEVAKVLGYKNTRDALSKHVDAEDKTTVAICDSASEPELGWLSLLRL